jgi:glycosyltransferase involved in cell wall biosynthesis
MSSAATWLPDAAAAGRARGASRLSRERPLRILTFSSLFPNAEQPGHGLFVWRRLQQLVASGGLEATVVAPVPWFPSGDARLGGYATFARIPRRETLAGVDVYHPRYPVLPKIGMTVAPLLMTLGVRGCIARLHRERGFDLIDAHYFYPDGVAAAWLARSLDLPLAITARGSDLNLIARYALPRTMIRLAARVSCLNVAVSSALAERLRDIGADPARTCVIPNGVDFELFRPGDRADARRALGLDARPWLLSAGHLVQNKGHDAVLRALVALPDYGLVIAGEGPEEASLRRLAAETRVAERVRFSGRVAPERMPLHYRAADCLVLASQREGMPNVLLESLACGTPVVATRVGGCAEIVCEAVAGRLIDAADPAVIAAAVSEVVRAAAHPGAVAAYARRFSWGPSVERQLAEFRRIARTWIA